MIYWNFFPFLAHCGPRLIKDTIDEAMALTRVAIKKNLPNKTTKVEFEQVSLSFKFMWFYIVLNTELWILSEL